MIKVDLRSNICTGITFVEFKNFTNPLSLNNVHFERSIVLNDVINWEVDKANNVSFVISVQLKFKLYKFFTAELFIKSTKWL